MDVLVGSSLKVPAQAVNQPGQPRKLHTCLRIHQVQTHQEMRTSCPCQREDCPLGPLGVLSVAKHARAAPGQASRQARPWLLGKPCLTSWVQWISYKILFVRRGPQELSCFTLLLSLAVNPAVTHLPPSGTLPTCPQLLGRGKQGAGCAADCADRHADLGFQTLLSETNSGSSVWPVDLQARFGCLEQREFELLLFHILPLLLY